MTDTLNFYEIESENLFLRYENTDVSEIQELLFKIFEKNSKLLEIGCGSGRDASFLTEKGFDIIAIDGSKNMIDEAKKIILSYQIKFFIKFYHMI